MTGLCPNGLLTEEELEQLRNAMTNAMEREGERSGLIGRLPLLPSALVASSARVTFSDSVLELEGLARDVIHDECSSHRERAIAYRFMSEMEAARAGLTRGGYDRMVDVWTGCQGACTPAGARSATALQVPTVRTQASHPGSSDES